MGCFLHWKGALFALIYGSLLAGMIYFIIYIITERIESAAVLVLWIPMTGVVALCFLYVFFCGWWSCDGQDPLDQSYFNFEIQNSQDGF